MVRPKCGWGAADEQGWFGTADLERAMKWYRMAAEERQAGAQFLLGSDGIRASAPSTRVSFG